MVHTEDHDGVTIRLYQDEDAEMPRGGMQDTLGIIADWHRRADVGDTHHGDRKVTGIELDALSRGGWPLLKRYLRLTEGAISVIPIGLLDHSGWHIYAGGGESASDPGGWDSGTVGFIYTTPAKIAVTGVSEAHIDDVLRGEINELDQYFTGDVYGYEIVSPTGDMLDSCWGFYGYDYALDEARSAAAGALEARQREWASEFMRSS